MHHSLPVCFPICQISNFPIGADVLCLGECYTLTSTGELMNDSIVH